MILFFESKFLSFFFEKQKQKKQKQNKTKKTKANL